MIEARNKIDLIAPEARAAALNESMRSAQTVALSARTGDGVEALLDAIENGLSETRSPAVIRLSASDGRAAAWLHAHGVVSARRDDETGIEIEATLSERERMQFAKEFPDAFMRMADAAEQPDDDSSQTEWLP
jgi:GTP-binding protein HflX